MERTLSFDAKDIYSTLSSADFLKRLTKATDDARTSVKLFPERFSATVDERKSIEFSPTHNAGYDDAGHVQQGDPVWEFATREDRYPLLSVSSEPLLEQINILGGCVPSNMRPRAQPAPTSQYTEIALKMRYGNPNALVGVVEPNADGLDLLLMQTQREWLKDIRGYSAKNLIDPADEEHIFYNAVHGAATGLTPVERRKHQDDYFARQPTLAGTLAEIKGYRRMDAPIFKAEILPFRRDTHSAIYRPAFEENLVAPFAHAMDLDAIDVLLERKMPEWTPDEERQLTEDTKALKASLESDPELMADPLGRELLEALKKGPHQK